MSTPRWARSIVIACSSLAVLAVAASAQSVITGVVRDASAGALPGVVVEVTSPALVEKTRSVVSDGGGVYRVEHRRPEEYAIAFSLPGFAQVRREGLTLPSNFTATIDADMQVGAAEIILVTGDAPMVDVHQASKTTAVNRDLLDLLPIGRTAQTAGALVLTTVMSAVYGRALAGLRHLHVRGAVADRATAPVPRRSDGEVVTHGVGAQQRRVGCGRT
jgi:hypothetical protein